MPAWSGHEARALRQAMRLSVRAFAEHLGVAVRTVAKWEAGGEKLSPRPDSQAILDTALNKADEQAQARFAHLVRGEGQTAPQPSGRPASAPTSAASNQPQSEFLRDSSGLETATASPVVEKGALPRGGRLECGTAAAPFPALAGDELGHVRAAMADARRYFDTDVVACVQRQLRSCAANDGAHGPAQTLPTVLGILGAIDAYACEVKPGVRRQLLSVGSLGAEFAGWLYRDLHRPQRAGFWYDRATEWAQEAGDTATQGYILLRKSQMAYDERDGLRVLTLAQAAQHGPWQLSHHVRAEVTQQEARGMAMLGEGIDVVEQKLDDARQLLDDARPDEEPHDQLGSPHNETTLTLRNASSYIEAGKPQRAAELYAHVLSGGHLSRRDRGYFTARMTSALALAGEPDSAADAGLEAIQLTAATASQRTRRELTRALFSLTPWQHRPGPRALREAVAASPGRL